MNKSETDKLLDAIGGVNDRWVKELMEEPDVKASHKVKPIAKRIIIAAAAALLSVSLVITVAANSDAIIAAIFERRQNLVDNKIGHIDESVTDRNITLTMEKVVVEEKHFDNGQFSGEFTVSFHNEDGVFDGGLKYSRVTFEGLFDADDEKFPQTDASITADGQKWCMIGSYSYLDPNPNEYDIFFTALQEFNSNLENPSDAVTLTGHVNGWYTDCRLTFYDITSYDGSKKYADKLSVNFTVSEDIAPPLEQLNGYKLDTAFEIEGVTFEIDSISVSPEDIEMKFTNSDADRVNIAGTECYAINYLAKLGASDEFYAKDKEIQELDAAASKKGETIEEQMENLTAWMMSDERVKLEGELWAMTKPTEDQNILNECYDIVIELKPESGAEITSIRTEFSGGGLTPAESTVTTMAKLSSPIYVDDIVRVYARKIGDPTKEITIWVPADDKGLDAFR